MIKKYVYLVILIVLSTIYGCKKIGYKNNPATGPSGNNAGSTIDTTKGYQPVTANSSTTYREVIGTAIDTLTNTITGATTTINGNPYYVVTSQSKTYGSSTGYYSVNNHKYTQRATSVNYGATLELLYLIDNVAVGSTWTAPVTDNGTVNNVPAQMTGTLVAKNISKTVSGMTFNNVVHTTILLQYNLGSGFATIATYDLYVAKGVGVIETDAVASSGIAGLNVTSTTSIISYNIK